MQEHRCVVGSCEKISAAMSLSPETVASFPKSWFLCVEHFRITLGAVGPPPPRKRTKHPAYGDNPEMTCYGLAGTCKNEGELYAGGKYCAEHSPRARQEGMVNLENGTPS